MEPVTTRIPSDTMEKLEELADETGDSKSEVARELIEKGMEYDELQRENARLQTRIRKLIDQREEHQELVEYVEHEMELHQRREERREAPVWARAKWWVFGRKETS